MKAPLIPTLKTLRVVTLFMATLVSLADSAVSGSNPPKSAVRREAPRKRQVVPPPPAAKPPAWRTLQTSPTKPIVTSVGPVSPQSIVSRKRPSAAGAKSKKVASPQLSSQSAILEFSATASSDADYRTPELIALAEGLQNDAWQIFDWVRTNIRYVHYHGCKKGAHLTFLERSGNDADQSALLVALFRAAGIDCKYVWGYIELPDTGGTDDIDWYHYLGVEPSELSSFVYTRGTPHDTTTGHVDFGTNVVSGLKFLKRIWVQAYVDDEWIDYDPSFKLIQPESALTLDQLKTMMGYSRATLYGGTVLENGTAGTNSITSLNYGNLSTYLSARTMELLVSLRYSQQTRTIGQTIGGWKPLVNSTISESSFPARDIGYPTGIFTTWAGSSGASSPSDTPPDDYYAKVQLQNTGVGLNWGPVNMASLRGRRLGLIFESNKATLKLEDDAPAAQASGTTANGNSFTLNASITHAHDTTFAETAALPCKGGGTYALVYGFDVTSEYAKTRREQLDRYDEQGIADNDTRMCLEALNVVGLEFLLQTELTHQLVAHLTKLAPTFMHRFGLVAQEQASGSDHSVHIDMPMNFSGFFSRVPDSGSVTLHSAITTVGFISSGMENGVIEQMQPATEGKVLSTTKILKLANDQAVPVYLGNSGNYYSSVRGQFTGYPSADMDAMDDAIDDGGEVLAPQSGNTAWLPQSGQATQWRGPGYLTNVVDSGATSLGFMIGGGYSGGFAGIYITIDPEPLIVSGSASGALGYQSISLAGDPVDLATGAFTHSQTLLTAGNGRATDINFSLNYSGTRRLKNDAKAGYGWTHSYYGRLVEMADIEGALGKKTPLEMASSIVGAVVALDCYGKRDLNSNGTATTDPSVKAKNRLSTALIANWMVDQIAGSGVAITLGDRVLMFHRQPDGTHTQPPGTSLELQKGVLQNPSDPEWYYLFEKPWLHGPTWHFQFHSPTDEFRLVDFDIWGERLYIYLGTTGKIIQVYSQNGETELDFSYSGPGGTLSSVSDNSSPQRTVTLSVDSNGDLTAITDPEGKSDNFTYLSGHLLETHKNHTDETIVSNVYDSSGRVVTQDTMGEASKRWKFRYAPGLAVEEEPASTESKITHHYFDEHQREIEVVNAFGHRFVTEYDAQHRVAKKHRRISDGQGGWAVNDTEEFTYNADNQLLTQKDAKGKTATYEYGSNHLLRVIDKRGNATVYGTRHTWFKKPLSITDREGNITYFTYSTFGDVATVQRNGFTTSFTYDGPGILNSITYPGGASISITNNSLGDPTTITDELGRQTEIAYNKRREVVSITSPGTATSGPRTTVTSYDNNRNKGSATNPRGFTTSYAYNSIRKLLTTTLPGGAVLTNHYNSRDQLDWTKNPLNQQTDFLYDALGRTKSVTDPLGRTITTTFADDERLTTTQGPAPFNYQTKITVNELGQVISDKNPLNHEAVPGYDDNGNKVTWTDRRGHLWEFDYDNENRLETTESPEGRLTTQEWNARGLLETITEPSGQETTLSYDGRGRLTGKTDAAGTTTYTLNNAGELTAVTRSSVVLSRTYHDSGQVKTYTNANAEVIEYDYDKNGNLANLKYPAIGSLPTVTVTYTYDHRDQLESVTDWLGRKTTYTRDAAGKLMSVKRPNSTRRLLRWDAGGQLNGFEEWPASGAPLAVRAFGRDTMGRVDKRLAYPQGLAWSEPAWTAVYNEDNQLTTLAGATLNYDDDGNLLASRLPDGPWSASGSSSGASGSYSWTPLNQLNQITRSDNSQQVNYTYDAEGNLIQQTDSVSGTTRWVIEPGSRRVLAKVAPNGDVTRYIYGHGLLYEVRVDGTVRYYHYDHVGSTVGLSDANGVVVGRADYSPYGALQGASGELATIGTTPFLFVGAHGVMTDPGTGLHYMRARWYSSHLRRFLNEDPAGFAGGENSYLYAGGNPISMIDPNGLRPTAFDSQPLFPVTSRSSNPSRSTFVPDQGTLTQLSADYDQQVRQYQYDRMSPTEKFGMGRVGGSGGLRMDGGDRVRVPSTGVERRNNASGWSKREGCRNNISELHAYYRDA